LAGYVREARAAGQVERHRLSRVSIVVQVGGVSWDNMVVAGINARGSELKTKVAIVVVVGRSPVPVARIRIADERRRFL
jgi:hypothetical protein